MTIENPADATVSIRVLTRIVVFLIALWSLLSGLVMLAFHGAGSDAMGAGLTDEAGQRLVGAHLLIFAAIFFLIALRFDRFGGLLWLPLIVQFATAATITYGMVNGDTDFGDGVLPVAVGVIFTSLLSFLLITERRMAAMEKLAPQGQRQYIDTANSDHASLED